MFIKVNRIVIVPTVNLWLSSWVILNHFIGSTVLTLPKDKYWYAVDDSRRITQSWELYVHLEKLEGSSATEMKKH